MLCKLEGRILWYTNGCESCRGLNTLVSNTPKGKHLFWTTYYTPNLPFPLYLSDCLFYARFRYESTFVGHILSMTHTIALWNCQSSSLLLLPLPLLCECTIFSVPYAVFIDFIIYDILGLHREVEAAVRKAMAKFLLTRRTSLAATFPGKSTICSIACCSLLSVSSALLVRINPPTMSARAHWHSNPAHVDVVIEN